MFELASTVTGKAAIIILWVLGNDGSSRATMSYNADEMSECLALADSIKQTIRQSEKSNGRATALCVRFPRGPASNNQPEEPPR